MSKGKNGVGVIVLAAGRGERFDASVGKKTTGKLMASLGDGVPVGVKTASLYTHLGMSVLAVVRQPGELSRRLTAQGCDILVADDAQQGMGASLAAGVRWYAAQRATDGTPRYDAVLVALGDMPWVKPSTLAAILSTASRDSTRIVVPMHNGVKGHPVLFGRAHWPALMQLEGDKGARGLLSDPCVLPLAVDDDGIHRDVDTYHDLDVLPSDPKY